MATRFGFLRRGVSSAVLLFVFAGLSDIRADQTVQVGPGIAFSPSTVTVAPGEAVIWDFQGFHTSTSDTSSGPEVWDSGFLSSGTFSHTFTTPGSYPFYCRVHSVPGGTTMAHTLRLVVVAEGVETEEQLAFLRQHRCDEMQGYLFSPPVAPEEFRELLTRRQALPAIA